MNSDIRRRRIGRVGAILFSALVAYVLICVATARPLRSFSSDCAGLSAMFR